MRGSSVRGDPATTQARVFGDTPVPRTRGDFSKLASIGPCSHRKHDTKDPQNKPAWQRAEQRSVFEQPRSSYSRRRQSARRPSLPSLRHVLAPLTTPHHSQPRSFWHSKLRRCGVLIAHSTPSPQSGPTDRPVQSGRSFSDFSTAGPRWMMDHDSNDLMAPSRVIRVIARGARGSSELRTDTQQRMVPRSGPGTRDSENDL